MIDIKMPSLGADMEKGTIVAWHVQPGSAVQKGDIIVDVETDKGTIAVDIWESGRIANLLTTPGMTVPVGATIAQLDESESPAEALSSAEIPHAPKSPEKSLTKEVIPPALGPKRRVSPLARKLAQDLGLDLNQIPDHQDGSPITKQDIEIFAKGTSTKDIPENQKPMTPPVTGISAEQSDRLRSAISTLMSRSQREIPHYFVESEINLTKMISWLEKTNASRSVQTRLLPIVPILKAAAIAAHKVQGINGIFEEGRYKNEEEVRLGIVLSLRTSGIVNPALSAPDKMSLNDIMTALMDLIQRARHGKLKSSEVSGQTLTITSLGDLGADRVMGRIYPPQVALVGIGRMRHRPWADGSMIGTAPTVYVTIAGDHRASDGLTGAAFIGAMDLLLQSPEKLDG